MTWMIINHLVDDYQEEALSLCTRVGRNRERRAPSEGATPSGARVASEDRFHGRLSTTRWMIISHQVDDYHDLPAAWTERSTCASTWLTKAGVIADGDPKMVVVTCAFP